METLKNLRKEKIKFKAYEKINSLVFSAEEEIIDTGYYKHCFKSFNELDQLIKKLYISYFSSLNGVFIKETSQAYENLNIYYDVVEISLEKFEEGDSKLWFWIFFLMVVTFFCSVFLLMFLTRG